MTVINDATRREDYTAVASQTVFPYTFEILDQDDIDVYLDGVLQTISTHYTVSGVGDENGGNITLVTPATGGEILLINGDKPVERQTEFATGQEVLLTSELNDQLSALAIMIQERERDLSRAIRADLASVAPAMQLPAAADRAGKYIKFADPSGDLEMADVSASTTVLSKSVIANLLFTDTAEEIAEAAVSDRSFRAFELERYGVVGDGVVDDSAAVQSCIDSMPADGGIITCRTPLNIRLGSGITITKTKFTSGGVMFALPPRARFTADSGVVAFTISGTSTTSLFSRFVWSGGQVVSAHGEATGAFKFENCDRVHFVNRPLISGFRAVTGDGSRYGIWGEYVLWMNIWDAAINNCDTGLRLEQDPTNAYRSTNLRMFAPTMSRCQRAVEIKDVFNADIDGSFENSSCGIYIHGEETTGTNCRNINIEGYFERNGVHILGRRAGSAENYGLDVTLCTLETLNTTFVDTEAFQVIGPTVGANKVDVECSTSRFERNSLTSAATLDFKIDGDENELGLQDAASAAVDGRVDLSGATNTIDSLMQNVVAAMATADATPSVELGRRFTITNAGAQSITQFDGGYPGKQIVITALDGNTTIDHTGAGAGIRNKSGSNDLMASGSTKAYVNRGSNIWDEI